MLFRYVRNLASPQRVCFDLPGTRPNPESYRFLDSLLAPDHAETVLSNNAGPVKFFFFFLFLHTSPFTPESGLVRSL
jgi:hypothetical protein